jgi:hypothetical protein
MTMSSGCGYWEVKSVSEDADMDEFYQSDLRRLPLTILVSFLNQDVYPLALRLPGNTIIL